MVICHLWRLVVVIYPCLSYLLTQLLLCLNHHSSPPSPLIYKQHTWQCELWQLYLCLSQILQYSGWSFQILHCCSFQPAFCGSTKKKLLPSRTSFLTAKANTFVSLNCGCTPQMAVRDFNMHVDVPTDPSLSACLHCLMTMFCTSQWPFPFMGKVSPLTWFWPNTNLWSMAPDFSLMCLITNMWCVSCISPTSHPPVYMEDKSIAAVDTDTFRHDLPARLLSSQQPSKPTPQPSVAPPWPTCPSHQMQGLHLYLLHCCLLC